MFWFLAMRHVGSGSLARGKPARPAVESEAFPTGPPEKSLEMVYRPTSLNPTATDSSDPRPINCTSTFSMCSLQGYVVFPYRL